MTLQDLKKKYYLFGASGYLLTVVLMGTLMVAVDKARLESIGLWVLLSFVPFTVSLFIVEKLLILKLYNTTARNSTVVMSASMALLTAALTGGFSSIIVGVAESLKGGLSVINSMLFYFPIGIICGLLYGLIGGLLFGLSLGCSLQVKRN